MVTMAKKAATPERLAAIEFRRWILQNPGAKRLQKVAALNRISDKYFDMVKR